METPKVSWWQNWMFAWVDLIVALISVCTIGLIWVDWDVVIRYYFAQNLVNKIKPLYNDYEFIEVNEQDGNSN